jgi:hypothetical protein
VLSPADVTRVTAAMYIGTWRKCRKISAQRGENAGPAFQVVVEVEKLELVTAPAELSFRSQ